MTDLGGRRYSGEGKRDRAPLAGAPEAAEPYIASPELVEAVNMALHLRRPLLLEGDPGVGKTRLAYAVAYELGFPLLPIYIRSTSRAQDLLYTFDAVRRLYDIQERAAGLGDVAPPAAAAARDREEEKREYVDLGRLGQAIELSERDVPSVVLIDEIDKADIDFPNDLLLVLDRLEFDVEEVKGWGFNALKGETREQRRNFLPLVIVTSNREKELPAPFLRRCLFYYIQFPNESELADIVGKHFGMKPDRLFDEALKKFWALHVQKGFTWRKAPSTSELLDWLKVLRKAEESSTLTADEFAAEFAARPLSQLPHLEALVKTQSDLDALSRLPAAVPVSEAKPGAGGGTQGD